jgi:predicted dithiol-disulfide oxidoreductase (DUF899 family)
MQMHKVGTREEWLAARRPDWTEGCPSCSAVADGYDGFVVHLEHHDVAFTAVSRAPLGALQAYQRRMGWSFPWASSHGGDFNFDFSVSFTEDRPTGEAQYNFRPIPGRPPPGEDVEAPGVSAFVLEDGAVYHTYSTYARGTDGLGRNETGSWFRRHDEYEKDTG